ncbi:6250_t:CDS:2, partial [Racocetra persica]
FENKAIELLLETCEHQIISSKDEVQDGDNQQFNLENETYSQDVLSKNESNEDLLRLYLGLIFTTWEDGTVEIVCTSFDDGHSYDLNPIIVQTAPHFHKLSKEMLEDIEFYTRSAEGMGAKIQYNLLKKLKTDAAEALQQLIALKANNLEWIVISNIESEENRLTALFWMSSLQ